MDKDNLSDISARNSYPAVYSFMAGGKETPKLLPLALVHTQVSRYVRPTTQVPQSNIHHSNCMTEIPTFSLLYTATCSPGCILSCGMFACLSFCIGTRLRNAVII